ncbi:hypothetical protein E4U55_007322 [Claviceps digitariae]|nr:hypothetical protein E4U55_007322 [Claviceps digitariae]
MGKMLLHPQGRRAMFSRPRPRSVFIIVLAALTTYFLVFNGPSPRLHMVPYKQDGSPPDVPEKGDTGRPKDEKPHVDTGIVANAADPGHHHEEPTGPRAELQIDIEDLANWRDTTDMEDPNDIVQGHETDGNGRDPGQVMKTQHEKDLRKMWRFTYKLAARFLKSNLIYGNTLRKLEGKDDRKEAQQKKLREDPSVKLDLSDEQPVRFNPYPSYNGDEWIKAGYAPYVPCSGPTGEVVEDLLVFRGRPEKWPQPKFGSYDLFGMDPNLCWERDTRLGPYGYRDMKKEVGESSITTIDWDKVNWGKLQAQCLKQNAPRFEMTTKKKQNPFLNAYPETALPPRDPREREANNEEAQSSQAETDAQKMKRRSTVDDNDNNNQQAGMTKESRTAILLRSYTGMEYTDNDRQVIRALISELSLKTGGQYEVFLLVHSKNNDLHIFDDDKVYQSVLNENVPKEFQDITVLWNDQQVWDLYPGITDDLAKSVHSAQWLSVQKFSQDHPQFEFIWNWEMDFRSIGHHYDFLEGLASFAKKQPRKYLWERNERFYIPSHHGDYDTTFRKTVAEAHGNESVWGPPKVPFINPVGPKPPRSFEEDDYQWGVGEEADLITLGPMFNPVDSQWIIHNHIWGYHDADHQTTDLPRRTTIVTQARLSKRLLAIMHVESLRGNHVASEMTTQTVALLHGLKAVFAPHPVFMDRDWKGSFLQKWFNPGPDGECGGRGSPMGWGRERRFQGVTWYYRAEPPNRLYNNWMGWSDFDIGGPEWEEEHGRPCLPSVLLHPIKNTSPTQPKHKTRYELVAG